MPYVRPFPRTEASRFPTVLRDFSCTRLAVLSPDLKVERRPQFCQRKIGHCKSYKSRDRLQCRPISEGSLLLHLIDFDSKHLLDSPGVSSNASPKSAPINSPTRLCVHNPAVSYCTHENGPPLRNGSTSSRPLLLLATSAISVPF